MQVCRSKLLDTKQRAEVHVGIYRVSHEKGIGKNLLVGIAHGFNSQVLNLFGFNI